MKVISKKFVIMLSLIFFFPFLVLGVPDQRYKPSTKESSKSKKTSEKGKTSTGTANKQEKQKSGEKTSVDFTAEPKTKIDNLERCVKGWLWKKAIEALRVAKDYFSNIQDAETLKKYKEAVSKLQDKLIRGLVCDLEGLDKKGGCLKRLQDKIDKKDPNLYLSIQFVKDRVEWLKNLTNNYPGLINRAKEMLAKAEKISGGDVPQKLVKAMQNLVTKYSQPYSFPYDPATENGNLGCAQVVSRGLIDAGIINKTYLITTDVIAALAKKPNPGWTKVNVPPFKAGDVVTWTTNQPDGHIGVVTTNGNTAKAISNSSSQRRPIIHNAQLWPITQAWRKV
ncbi:CHAP domain-containing protein [bacterium]|nr:CHAP domain-containing protein [bacterium]